MNPSGAHLVIRADGGPAIGMGHVVRCSALGQAWRDLGGAVTLVTVAPLGRLEARLAREGIQTIVVDAAPGSSEDANATLAVAKRNNARHVVMDGYDFDLAYQQMLVRSELATVCIDDYAHADGYVTDLVVNQNLDTTKDLYTTYASGAHFLLGSQFVMLRRDFTTMLAPKRCSRRATRRVLVTMGGSDPENVTSLVVHALSRATLRADCAVVVGGANPHRAAIAKLVTGFDKRMRVCHDVPSLRRLMRWADVVVCAGGTTAWESAFMGLPMVTIVLAKNQALIADALAKHEVSVNLGWHASVVADAIAGAVAALLHDSDRRSQIATRAEALVDGLGARRVAMAIESLPGKL